MPRCLGLSRMRRVDAARADDDHLAERLTLRAGLTIEVLHAGRQAVVTGHDPGDDRIRSNLEAAGFERERQEMVGRTEERCSVTAGAAVAAVVTRGEAAGRARHVRAASGDNRDSQLGEALLEQAFAAARRGRRLEKLAARQRIRIVGAPAHADQLFDLIVVRRDLRVRDRPRNLPAVAIGGCQVDLRVAEADAPPHVGLAAVSPHAGQLERPIRAAWCLLLAIAEKLQRTSPRFTLAGLPGARVRTWCDRFSPASNGRGSVAREVSRGHRPHQENAFAADHRIHLAGDVAWAYITQSAPQSRIHTMCSVGDADLDKFFRGRITGAWTFTRTSEDRVDPGREFPFTTDGSTPAVRRPAA